MQGTAQQLVEIFEYPAGPEPHYPSWEGVASMSSGAVAEFPRPSSRVRFNGGLDAEIHAREIEESRRVFAAGRERGLEEGRQAEREWHAAAFVRVKNGAPSRLRSGLMHSRRSAIVICGRWNMKS